jgi:hypothetical protein
MYTLYSGDTRKQLARHGPAEGVIPVLMPQNISSFSSLLVFDQLTMRLLAYFLF